MSVRKQSSRLDRGLVAATSLGFAVVQLDVSVVNVAIRPISDSLGGGVSALQWVVGAYTITFAALILTCGALGDRIGARRVYVAGFALLTLASMACGAAPGIGALIALALRYAEETPRAAGRSIDLSGQLTAIVALSALAGSLIEGGVHGDGSALVLAGFACAIASGAAFVLIERRRREPMLPPSLFRIAAFRSAALIGVVINVAFYGLIFVLSLFFQRAQGMSPLHAGLAFAPMTAVVFAVNIFAGRHSSGRAARPLVMFGAVCLALGSLGLLGAGAHSSYLALVAQLVAIGAGLGLIVPIITAALLGSVEPGRAGVAAGTLNSARQSGSVIGVAVCGSLTAQGLVTGLHDSLLLCAAVGVTVVALARGLRPSN